MGRMTRVTKELPEQVWMYAEFDAFGRVQTKVYSLPGPAQALRTRNIKDKRRLAARGLTEDDFKVFEGTVEWDEV